MIYEIDVFFRKFEIERLNTRNSLENFESYFLTSKTTFYSMKMMASFLQLMS